MNDTILLSIIIPMYNTEIYTCELLDILMKQLDSNIEIIVVDNSTNDVSDDFTHKYNINYIKTVPECGVSKARNIGIDIAKGKYIAFIDSDDLVSENYISKIKEKINNEFDYCFISWEWFGELSGQIIITDNCPDWNCAVWNRIWSRDFIGNIRFDENRNIAEDAQFVNNVINNKNNIKKENISDVVYKYRTGRSESLTNMFGSGKISEFRC